MIPGNNNTMKDRELETWREQWNSGAAPTPEIQSQLQTKIHKRIKRHNLGFIFNNIFAAMASVFATAFAIFAVHQQPSRLRIAWALGLLVLLCVTVGYRLWVQRGTWRSQSQSTRAFVELWQRRTAGKLRLILAGFYLIPAWLVFCVALVAVHWSTFGPDIHAHPRDWELTMLAVVAMISGSFLFLAWYRRRKLAELNEVTRLLRELKE